MKIFTQEELQQELEKTGALLTGHFILTSGLRSPKYLQCAKLLQHPAIAERIGASLAHLLRDLDYNLVAAPAIGGILVAHEIARAAGVRAVFSEREGTVMTFRRGLEVSPGDRAIVVEDVVTTGGSLLETVEAVKANGGTVVGVASIVDRSGGKVDLGYPLKSLYKLDVPTYKPEDIPAELAAIPPVKPGSRKFQA